MSLTSEGTHGHGAGPELPTDLAGALAALAQAEWELTALRQTLAGAPTAAAERGRDGARERPGNRDRYAGPVPRP